MLKSQTKLSPQMSTMVKQSMSVLLLLLPMLMVGGQTKMAILVLAQLCPKLVPPLLPLMSPLVLSSSQVPLIQVPSLLVLLVICMIAARDIMMLPLSLIKKISIAHLLMPQKQH